MGVDHAIAGVMLGPLFLHAWQEWTWPVQTLARAPSTPVRIAISSRLSRIST
jgi:hypothetical protein